MFEFYNNNPNNADIFDCSIRSLANATGTTWKQAYEELSENGKHLGLMMDSVESIEYYLDNKYPRVCFEETSVREFIYNHPNGSYVISMPNHLTSVVNGINRDTFPTLDREIWCAWRIY